MIILWVNVCARQSVEIIMLKLKLVSQFSLNAGEKLKKYLSVFALHDHILEYSSFCRRIKVYI